MLSQMNSSNRDYRFCIYLGLVRIGRDGKDGKSNGRHGYRELEATDREKFGGKPLTGPEARRPAIFTDIPVVLQIQGVICSFLVYNLQIFGEELLENPCTEAALQPEIVWDKNMT